jgi:hypothetical protein
VTPGTLLRITPPRAAASYPARYVGPAGRGWHSVWPLYGDSDVRRRVRLRWCEVVADDGAAVMRELVEQRRERE